jgi:predicted nucleotidyltransferase
MEQSTLDKIIQQIIPVLKQAEVRKAALFGSYVRGDNNEDSDVDILVDLPRGKTLLDLVGLKQDLEEVLQRKVDVVEYGGIHPLLKDSILASQYQIF